MKKSSFYVAIVALVLIASQCNPIEPPPDETGIKPQRDIPEKWVLVAVKHYPNGFDFYNTANILEFRSKDSTYKVYIDGVWRGDGTYSISERYTDYANGFVHGTYNILNTTGYSLSGFGQNVLEKHITVRMVGDSTCPPAPDYTLPDYFWDSLRAYTTSNELLIKQDLSCLGCTAVFYAKME
jgi:hypothetical protein